MENKYLYLISMAGGQVIRLEGSTMTLVSTYGFNPAVERIKFNHNTLEAMGCQPCSEEVFRGAVQTVLSKLDLEIELFHSFISNQISHVN